MTKKNEKCGCACHLDPLNEAHRGYEHDSECCEGMNGVVRTSPPAPQEKNKECDFVGNGIWICTDCGGDADCKGNGHVKKVEHAAFYPCSCGDKKYVPLAPLPLQPTWDEPPQWSEQIDDIATLLLGNFSGTQDQWNSNIAPEFRILRNMVHTALSTQQKEAYERGFQAGHAKERWLKDEVEKQARQEERNRAVEETTITSVGRDELYCEWFRCSSCKSEMITEDSNFCPVCGKKISRPKQSKQSKENDYYKRKRKRKT
jgi:hypothetical protein